MKDYQFKAIPKDRPLWRYVWVSMLIATLTFIAMVELPQLIRNHREAEAETRKDRIPHVVREADGCKVYEYVNDRGSWVSFVHCEIRAKK